MVISTKVVDLIEEIGNSDSFSTEQIVNACIFGSYSGLMQAFTRDKVYQKDDKVAFLTDNGEIIILVANQDNVSGDFNAVQWDEWNIVDEISGMYRDYVLMSWNQPTLRRNKVWLQIKNESLQDAREAGIDDIDGLLIYKNLTISSRRPATMTNDIVWGQITPA